MKPEQRRIIDGVEKLVEKGLPRMWADRIRMIVTNTEPEGEPKWSNLNTDEKKLKELVSLIGIAWAIGWKNGYDEGWCDADEGIKHNENKVPPMPSSYQMDQITTLWKEVKEELNDSKE